MAGSEKLRKILEAAQERVKDREKEEGGGGRWMVEKAWGKEREEARERSDIGRTEVSPRGNEKTGGASSLPRSDKAKEGPPCGTTTTPTR